MRVAVIGSGVAGLGAAWALSRVHDVTLYESDERLGGHANTVEIEDAGRRVAVDTGFIVYNPHNYPNLVRLFDAVGVPTEPSDMSFSVSVGGGAFEYQARGLGLLAQPSNLLRGGYRTMIRDILRFCREAPSVLGAGGGLTTGEYLAQERYSAGFRDDFLLPMVGCIWSSSLTAMLDYPIESLVRFLQNHRLLDVGSRPGWRTVSGGSREYVRRVSASFADGVRLATPVTAVERAHDHVTVRDATGGIDRFDHVVFASHADTTLRILGAEASLREREVLAAFRFSHNEAVLHRDPTFMPRRRRAWSSWNYLAEGRPGTHDEGAVSLSYWMNRLQNLRTERPVIVTLNPVRRPADVVASFSYDHPIYDRVTVDAQARLPGIQGDDRTWFAGAWTGYGFHEDGLRSGLAVAAALGAPAPWAGAPRSIEEGLADGTSPAPRVFEEVA
jgi:predicted NAD/FAD-binding protein